MELGEFFIKSWYWILTILILLITTIAQFWKQITKLWNKNQDTVHAKDISALRTEQSKDHELQDQKIEYTDKLASAHLEILKREIDLELGKQKGKTEKEFLMLYSEMKTLAKLMQTQTGIAESNQRDISKLTTTMETFKIAAEKEQKKSDALSELLQESSNIMANITSIIEVKSKLDEFFPLLESIMPFIPKWTEFNQKTVQDLKETKMTLLEHTDMLNKHNRDLIAIKARVNIP